MATELILGMTSESLPIPYKSSSNTPRNTTNISFNAFRDLASSIDFYALNDLNVESTWVSIDLGSNISMEGINLYSTNAIDAYSRANPKNFTILTSTNGTTFTEVKSFVATLPPAKKSKQTFYFDSVISTRYLRFRVDTTHKENGTGLAPVIGKITFNVPTPIKAQLEFYNADTLAKITNPITAMILKNGVLNNTQTVIAGVLYTGELDSTSTWTVKTLENNLFNALVDTVFNPTGDNPVIKLYLKPTINKTLKFYLGEEITLTTNPVKLNIYKNNTLLVSTTVTNGQYTRSYHDYSHTFEIEALDKVYFAIPKTDFNLTNATDVIVKLKVYSVSNKTLILQDEAYKKFTTKTENYIFSNIIPNMTSETSPSGKVMSSGAYASGYEGWRAFDGKISTDSECWVSNSSTGFLSYEFPESVAITGYAITSRNYAGRRDVKKWTFEGSNDGSNWTVLDSRANEPSWIASERRVYTFKNNNLYKIYRINVSEVHAVGDSGLNYISIAELEMCDFVMNLYSYWSTISSTLPTQEQFLLDGMDSLSPLLDRRIETLEPLPMTNKSEILQGEEGKVFSKTISLKKYLDIRSMKVKVE